MRTGNGIIKELEGTRKNGDIAFGKRIYILPINISPFLFSYKMRDFLWRHGLFRFMNEVVRKIN